MKILFTGAATPSGGYLASMLASDGHQIITVGKGDKFNSDFRFLSPEAVNSILRFVVSKFRSMPDVVIHNARLSERALIPHALMVNVTARAYLDQAILASLREEQTFRSIHILGWKPTWQGPLPEIMISRAAQLVLPAAVSEHVKVMRAAAAEADHAISEERKVHEKDVAKQKADHEAFEELTAKHVEKTGEKYEKKPFKASDFCGRVERVRVPKADAVLLVPRVDQAANGMLTREDVLKALRDALALPHNEGNVETLVISTQK